LESIGIENQEKQNNSNLHSAKIDRVVLDSQSMEIVKTILIQVQQELGELIEVSQKEIVNFLLQERSQPFSEIELVKIRERNFDMVKALKHAMELAKQSKSVGKEISIDEIFKFIQTPIVIDNQTSKSPRARKKKEIIPPGTTSKFSDGNKEINATSDAISDLISSNIKDSKIEKSHSL
jgi:hypothetical protein